MSRDSRSYVPAVANRIIHSPSFHLISSTVAYVDQNPINHRTLRAASVSGDVCGSKGPIAMQEQPPVRPHTAELRISSQVYRVWCSHLSGRCSAPREQLQCCGCGAQHTANYCGCIKWNESKTALAKRTPEVVRKCEATTSPPIRKLSGSGLCRAGGPQRGLESRSPTEACCQGNKHDTTYC